MSRFEAATRSESMSTVVKLVARNQPGVTVTVSLTVTP